MPKVRARLLVITDAALAGARGIVPAAELAIAGGAGLVQYRDKHKTTREKMAEVQALLAVCRAAGVPRVVNDDVGLALAAGADGVHVGQDDLPVAAVRRLLGSGRIVGCSATTMAGAREGVRAGADYLGLGPIFATPTKTDAAAPGGLDLARAAAAEITLPWFAIGGINAGTIAAVVAAGARRGAVVAAVMAAADPRAAAAELAAALPAAGA